LFGGIFIETTIWLCHYNLRLIYHTSIGTLPTVSGQEPKDSVKADSTGGVEEVEIDEQSPNESKNINPFQELEVSAGDTLLSIVEEISANTHTLSISEIIVDFEELNPGEKANSLQIGKKYKFPLYE
jgi:hypothetical protein